MHKTTMIFFLSFLFSSFISFSQCLTALSPPACTGTEPSVSEGDIISGGTTKWYYGAATVINTLTLDGGTLVVCGNLTVDKFYMNTGKIFVRQGGRFVIGSGIGSGLQFKGDCAVYNYGTFEVQRNLTLENNASAATPNIVINALNTSVFKMSNQYMVINNAYSKFVNNGIAEFWGLITDNQSAAGSVCLGNGSTTKMAILINKVANSYTAPSGNACVHVFQYSEFYGQLTANPALLVCAGSGHVSNSGCIPFGCQPNNWGAAQVFTNCAGCAAIAVLPVRFISFAATRSSDASNKLQWETGTSMPAGIFQVMRSADGKNFYMIDSLIVTEAGATVFNFTDNKTLLGNNYYMIRFTNNQTGLTLNSKIVKVVSQIMTGFNIYPVPFDNKFFINYQKGIHPLRILLTDLTGKEIHTSHFIREDDQMVEVNVIDKLQSGLYIIHMKTDKSVVAKTVFKR